MSGAIRRLAALLAAVLRALRLRRALPPALPRDDREEGPDDDRDRGSPWRPLRPRPIAGAAAARSDLPNLQECER